MLGQLGLGAAVLTRSRANGFLNMLESLKRRARMLLGDLPRFPSLLIGAERTSAQGAFAEAQNAFLRPDGAVVDRLVEQLAAKKVGVVAHFYMDPEVQGVLSSAGELASLAAEGRCVGRLRGPMRGPTRAPPLPCCRCFWCTPACCCCRAVAPSRLAVGAGCRRPTALLRCSRLPRRCSRALAPHQHQRLFGDG